MVEIWKAAGEIEEDTFEFEERILAQMMFTGKITDISTHIFSHYCSRGPKDRIVKAYLSLNSYLYFVKECSMPEELFELIITGKAYRIQKRACIRKSLLPCQKRDCISFLPEF